MVRLFARVKTEAIFPAPIANGYHHVAVGVLDSRHITPRDIDVYRRVNSEPEVRDFEVADFVMTPPAAPDRRRDVRNFPRAR